MGRSDELKVGGELLLFLFEELLFPDAFDAVIVVIAGDGEDWNLKITDSFASGRHELFFGRLSVEQITSDQYKLRLVLCDIVSKTVDSLKALLRKL